MIKICILLFIDLWQLLTYKMSFPVYLLTAKTYYKHKLVEEYFSLAKSINKWSKTYVWLYNNEDYSLVNIFAQSPHDEKDKCCQSIDDNVGTLLGVN